MNFVIAGVDFLISEGKPYFIEVNSAPGPYAMNLLEEKTRFTPISDFARAVLERVESPRAALLFSQEGDSGGHKRLERLREFFPAEMCNIADQNFSSKELVSDEGKRFEPNIILMNSLGFSQRYRFDVPRINPDSIVRISLDKHLSSRIVSEMTGVLTPRTFLSLHSHMAESIVRSIDFPNGIVVKGNFGQAGDGVIVLNDASKLPKTRGIKVIQERIHVLPLKDARYWDVRALVVDGKFSGAAIRYANNPVVNIHQGGKMMVAPKEVVELVAKPAEQVVAAIAEKTLW